MATRETVVSKSVEYDSAACTNCSDEVFVDTDMENVDNLPKGVPTVVTGGENMTLETTGANITSQDYRIPKVLVKLFGLESTSEINQSYLCPSCAKSLYNFEPDQ
ncbi:hypothetical protein [Halosimplex pelagicum]|uniref:Uncharacterized protein n=1 Tax=Halosimplex pelagicum TaxID=869886 RepID=A0A7D5SYI1_9EURY|nr:hypothetical protein [Halosimplex pelagicum]QLH84827.1 hypothetical protein HZS54_25780 [Halosimplex pelagicum]